MRTTIGALAFAAALAPSVASAQLTGNFTLTSDYRFRGISQSFKQPAVQGGIDWAHPGGWYLGNWNSSVSGNQYPNGSSLEMDFYGGYKFPVGKDLTVDVGGLYYYYPAAYYSGFGSQKPRYDNFEIYAGGTMGPFSAKLFIAITDFFGLDTTTGGKSSNGSWYLDLNYATEIAPKLTLAAHLGYQNVRNYTSNPDFSYFDYKLGVTYDWSGWMLGAAIVGTDADKKVYFATDSRGSTKNVGGTGLVVSIGKTF